MIRNSITCSRLLFLICLLLLLTFVLANGNGQPKKKLKHAPKCKSYRPTTTTLYSKYSHGWPGRGRVKRVASGVEGEIQTMPWMVYLNASYHFNGLPQYNISASIRSGFCTATLISPRFVLTVAHCLRAANMTDDDTIQVYYGAANFSQGRLIVRDRSAVHIHPNVTLTYDPSAPFPVQTRDMALLDLGQDLEFDDNVHSICLSCLYDAYPQGPSIVAGWGNSNGACNNLSAIYPEVFRYANVSFHPCLTAIYDKADTVCSFADRTHGIGGGDSGGPMLAPVGPKGDYMQICINGGNNCNLSKRENSCTKIDGHWLKEVTGIECQNYSAPF